MPRESTIPLVCNGRKFRFIVMVSAKGEPKPCIHCNGTGSIFADDDIWFPSLTCDFCRGDKTQTNMNIWDDELEDHLLKCMDEFLSNKYKGK